MIKETEMPVKDRPLSEIYRLKGLEWADHQAAWYALEKNRKTTLERIKMDMWKKAKIRGEKITEAYVDRAARCSAEWEQYQDKLFEHNEKRLHLRVELDSIDMAAGERMSAEANARKERGHY